MKTIAILVGKFFVNFGKVLHRGSSLPGKIALKLDKKLLSKLEYPSIRVAVTGSSGKGSTSKIIANVLKDNNYSVCFNEEGSNLAWGITTCILRNISVTGKIKTDILLIEVDERYAKEIFKDISPTHIVVTNITKDQPPRHYHVDIVYNDIINSVQDISKIITNMDDPFLRNIEKDRENKILYYSLAKNKYSYKSQIFENLNIYYCPYCGDLLIYEYYNFETLGKYKCNKCKFKYVKPLMMGENLDLMTQTMVVNNNKLNIGGEMLYNAYNTLAAYTTLIDVGLDEENIIKSINKFNEYKTKSFKENDKIFYAISCKAENCTTYNQAIFNIIQNKDKKDIIIGWKEISRRYKHFDVSWLYDVEFELLNNDTLNKIYACGVDKENIKKRLLLAGISEEKIVTCNNIQDIKEVILNSKAKGIYGILNFDYIFDFEQTFKEET